jgi:hypothetical protein
MFRKAKKTNLVDALASVILKPKPKKSRKKSVIIGTTLGAIAAGFALNHNKDNQS